jgi:hypothetical protein
MVQQPLVGQDLLVNEASRSHSDTLYSVGLLWTSDQPDAETSYLTTHNTHKKQNLHASDSIRTHNPSKGVAADRRLRPCGHWDVVNNYSEDLTKSRNTICGTNSKF